MENQQKKIFANCSQTVRNHCEFRNVLATSFALRNPIPQYTVALRNLPLTKPMRNFALPKFAVSSQTNFAMRKFRNAKFAMRKFRNAKFAMRISQCQFRNANFAMPNSISQCQFQFRNAKFNFAMPISNSQCQYTVHLSHNQSHCEISHCEIHNPLCENSQTHFALPNSLPLRNSHLQALSSSVINATDFQTW